MSFCVSQNIDIWLFIKLCKKSLISRCKNLMNQVIWFDNLCLFTMGGVFSGWFYRCGSRMYDEDVEVQLVTYGTTPLTLVCSVWDSVQIYTACFLHLDVFSCHQIKCTQGQMFMRHMPLRSYRIINWCCPNYDIRMLGNYFVSGIPLWKGPPLNSWVFFGSAANHLQPMQPTGLGSSTIEDTIEDPEAETGGGMTGGSSRSAWNRGFRMQFWWCILMYFVILLYTCLLGSKESLHAVISCSVDGTMGSDEW